MEAAGFGALCPGAALTPRGGKLQHKAQPVSPGLCSASLPCSSPHGRVRSFLSGKATCPKGWQQLLEPKWSLAQSCSVAGVSCGARRCPVPRGAHSGLSWPPPSRQALLSVPALSTQLCVERQHRLLCRTSRGPGLTLGHSTDPGGLTAPQIPLAALPM